MLRVRIFGFVALAAAAAVACSSTPASAPRRVVEGPCSIVIEEPPLLDRAHVPASQRVEYSSNPATSGPHDGRWATYGEHAQPIEPRLYVHNLEHGAVVFFYRCDLLPDCPAAVEALRRAASAIPYDLSCRTTGVRSRTLIVPSPDIDVPIAAAVWGKLYKSECVDPKSLGDFAFDNYGKGPEDTCSESLM
jgi:hypothetical protein